MSGSPYSTTKTRCGYCVYDNEREGADTAVYVPRWLGIASVEDVAGRQFPTKVPDDVFEKLSIMWEDVDYANEVAFRSVSVQTARKTKKLAP